MHDGVKKFVGMLFNLSSVTALWFSGSASICSPAKSSPSGKGDSWLLESSLSLAGGPSALQDLR